MNWNVTFQTHYNCRLPHYQLQPLKLCTSQWSYKCVCLCYSKMQTQITKIVIHFNCYFSNVTLCTLHTLVLSVCHMVDREFHCTSLQHGRRELHLYSQCCLVLTVEIGPHTHTLCENVHDWLPWDIHNTPGSRMMGRYTVQESSRLFLVLKHSTLHMGHCVQQQSLKGQFYLGNSLQSHTQPHTSMLFQSVSQQCR